MDEMTNIVATEPSPSAKILLIEQEKKSDSTIAQALSDEHYEIASRDESALRESWPPPYDAILLNVNGSGREGLRPLFAIQELLAATPDGPNATSTVPIIVLVNDNDMDTAVEAARLGAYDFVLKPVHPGRLRLSLRNALAQRALSRQLFGASNQAGVFQERIVGISGRMETILQNLERLSASDITVLLQGESGTGKELLARTIHARSARRDKPFVVVNCSGMPDHVLQRELFGPQIGAPEGTASPTGGKLAQAEGGVLFLDEIGDLKPNLQIKLLNLLQDRCYEPAGSAKAVPVDIRLIAATKKDLEAEMKKGAFRDDLYYRINVCPIFAPPLRERREDIPVLCEYFLEKYSRDYHKKIETISQQALDHLMNYSWPGNVRELEIVVERSLVTASGPVLLPEHLPPTVRASQIESREGGNGHAVDLRLAVKQSDQIIPIRDLEIAMLKQALKLTNYNLSITASRLGIGRTTLYRKLHKYQIPLPR